MTDTTRPGEHAKIKALAGDDPRWQRLLTDVAILLDRSEQSQNWQRGTDEWRADHDRNDEVRFAKGDARMVAIESKLTGVKSSADDYADTAAQLKGGWKAVAGFAFLIGVGYACLQAIQWFIDKVKP